MNNDQRTVLKTVLTIMGIILIVGILTHLKKTNETTLADYAAANPEIAYATHEEDPAEGAQKASEEGAAGKTDNTKADASGDADATNTGDKTGSEDGKDLKSGDSEAGAEDTGDQGKDASLPEDPEESLNPEDSYERPEDAFYYEPLSEELIHYITGISYPLDADTAEVSLNDLRYVHILHYDFEGKVTEGELICNEYIAQDLVEIFYELYRNEYQLEKVKLIDEYLGDDHLSMADNNTSCFNYRVVDDTTSLSKHAYGLALDINPFYNPYVRADSAGGWYVSPEGADPYADRSKDFPHKIDENDLCYQLFTEHGFFWGGNWKWTKDYQHFQKVPE